MPCQAVNSVTTVCLAWWIQTWLLPKLPSKIYSRISPSCPHLNILCHHCSNRQMKLFTIIKRLKNKLCYTSEASSFCDLTSRNYHHLHGRLIFYTNFKMLVVPGMVNSYCMKLISWVNISWYFESLSISVRKRTGCYDFHSHKKEWGVWRNLPCWTKLLLG